MRFRIALPKPSIHFPTKARVALLAVTALTFASCAHCPASRGSGSSAASNKTQALVNDVALSALDLSIRRAGPSANIVLAPTGIVSSSYFLSLGARGSTREKIRRYLNQFDGGKDLDAADASAYFRAVGGERPVPGFGVQRIHWSRNRGAILPQFAKRVQRQLFAPTKVLNWADAPTQSLEAMNQWATQTSQGLIPKVFSQPLPSDAFSAFVEIFFADLKWKDKFRSSSSPDLSFSVPGGQSKKVESFFGESDSAYYEHPRDGYRLAKLATKNADVDVLFLDPGPRKSAASLVQKLSGKKLRRSIHRLETRSVQWRIPKVDLEMAGPHNLNAYFVDDGCMACGQYGGDFGEMTKIPMGRREIRQSCTLRLDEKGVRATSVTTTVSFEAIAVLPDVVFRLDHPFVAFIWHNPTQTPLMVAYIGDPQSSAAYSYSAAQASHPPTPASKAPH